MATVYLSLGSNLGDRKNNLARALNLLSEYVKMNKCSSLYETEPVGYSDQPYFLNAVCRGSTGLAPGELLGAIKEIETALGRIPSFRNAPRVIDIDILFYDNEVVESESLTIPHPRLSERAFVLIPFMEIEPELKHPVSGETVKVMVDKLGTITGVRKSGEAREISGRRHDVSGIG